MSSIRPLITITILVAVGVFLFTKINESPVPLPPEMQTALGPAATTEIPPLSTTSTPAAPAWNDPATSTTAAQPQWATGTSESAAVMPPTPPLSLPADNSQALAPQTSGLATAPAQVPPIPELPPVETPAQSNLAAVPAPAETQSIPLPANIPVAQYPSDTAAPSTPPAATPGAVATQISTTMASTPPTADATAPARASSPVAESDDRYGITPVAQPPAVSASAPAATMAMAASTPPAAPTAALPQPTSTFASEWPQIQGALDRQELVAAHEMLSRWYENPSLTPAETQQVELLLSQLAGTVVYSTEHRLEPPYTVHAGDTLQTIAQQYSVPWQLLAKINGIPAANMVQPGQQLKVVHGPFSALVELDKNQLTLMLDGRYAGRFPITVDRTITVNEGQWVLEQKLVQPLTQDSTVVSASYTPSAVEHVLVLRSESPTAAGATISMTGGKPSPSGPAAVAPAAIQLSPKDVEEVADILSVGSPVTIRR
jgi:LysM repeat protein